jgi:hypothetical protein
MRQSYRYRYSARVSPCQVFRVNKNNIACDDITIASPVPFYSITCAVLIAKFNLNIILRYFPTLLLLASFACSLRFSSTTKWSWSTVVFVLMFRSIKKHMRILMKSILQTFTISRAERACAKKRLIVGSGALILADTFTHGWVKHKIAFEAVVITVQYQMDHGSPIFSV